MRKLSKPQVRLLSLHRRQFRLFDRTAGGIQREFRKLPEAQEELSMVTKLSELVHIQFAGAVAMLETAKELEGDGNRTPAFFDKLKGGPCYDYLTSRRKMVEHLGEMDEWRKLLGAIREVIERAKPFKSDSKVWGAGMEMSWRLAGGQYQVEALSRQAEAIQCTQDALFRSFGLQFWQGRKRYVRYEGDRRSQ